MPVEIKELIIRTVINDSAEQADSMANSDRSKTGSIANKPVNEIIIQECVRQVTRILKRTQER